MANVPAGTYLVYANVRDKQPETRRRYVLTYYPSATELTHSAPLSLNPGGELSVTIRLRQELQYRVSGEVVFEDGRPGRAAEGLLLVLESSAPGSIAGAPGRPMARVQDGAFVFSGVLPGSYRLKRSAMEVYHSSTMARLTPAYFGELQISVRDQDVADVRFPVRNGVAVKGRVSYPADSEPTEKVSANVLLDSGEYRRTTRLADTGEFSFQEMAPGRYRIYLLSLPEHIAAGDVRVAGRPLPNDILDLSAAPSIAVEVRLTNNAASVAGVVTRDNRPAPDVLVTLTPAQEPGSLDPNLVRTLRTDAAGKFSFGSLSATSYRLWAWENLEPRQALDPEVLNRYAAAATVVTCSKGSHETATLKLIATE
jgi:hypothetical protein